MTFKESEVSRATDGKFTEKTGAPAEVALKPGVIDRGDGIVCEVRVSWTRAWCKGCGWDGGDFSSAKAANEAADAHRENPGYDEVAISPLKVFPTVKQSFFKDGKLHREGAPAVRLAWSPPGDGEYYREGKLHRTDGPALIDSSAPDSMNEWWVDGEQVELTHAEKRDLWDDLDMLFDTSGVTAKYTVDEDWEARRTAIEAIQEYTRAQILNARVGAGLR
jgi:hypothetical protein